VETTNIEEEDSEQDESEKEEVPEEESESTGNALRTPLKPAKRRAKRVIPDSDRRLRSDSISEGADEPPITKQDVANPYLKSTERDAT
jgi:hypothetical protein